MFDIELEDIWMETYTGRKFHPFDINVESIDLLDIAWSLSHQCRFNAHCYQWWSVGQHSILVGEISSHMVEDLHRKKELALHGLLHDAHEAYLGDIIHPIKLAMKTFDDFDNFWKSTTQSIDEAIYQKFDIELPDEDDKDIVKLADNIALFIEAKHIMRTMATTRLDQSPRLIEASSELKPDMLLIFYNLVEIDISECIRIITNGVKDLTELK